jgi:hypothetical protein
MNVNIKNYSCFAKNSRINTNCPNFCYNKKKCKGKCKSACKCISLENNRILQRCKSQKQLGLLSNSLGTQYIRDGKCQNNYNTYIYTKPKYNKIDMNFYNKIYKRVYNSIVSTYIGNRFGKVKATSTQMKHLIYYANQYTVMWLRKFASAQGTTVDGWPATSLNGDNNNHFSDIQDGYATNCCIGKNRAEISFIKKAITDPQTFCRLTNNYKCSSTYCAKLKQLINK